MDKEKIEFLLDKYYNDEMNNKELMEFESLLKTNPSLKKAKELEDKIYRGIQYHNQEKITNAVLKSRKDFENRTISKSKRLWLNRNGLFVGIAASISILVGSIMLFTKDNINPRDRYLDHLKTYQENSLGQFGLRNSINVLTLNDSLNYAIYNSLNNNKLANDIFQKLLTSHPNNEKIALQFAIHLFKEGDNIHAFERFEPLSISNSKVIKEEAEIGLIMAGLNLSNPDQSLKLLEIIGNNSNHKHYKLAMEQLELMK